jgi:hypothetical protein
MKQVTLLEDLLGAFPSVCFDFFVTRFDLFT